MNTQLAIWNLKDRKASVKSKRDSSKTKETVQRLCNKSYCDIDQEDMCNCSSTRWSTTKYITSYLYCIDVQRLNSIF